MKSKRKSPRGGVRRGNLKWFMAGIISATLITSLTPVGANVRDNVLRTLASFTKDGTATSDDLLQGKVAYSKGETLTGTIPSKTAQTYTPGTANQTINSGQYLSGAQTILGDSDLIASNIKSGVNLFGVTGTCSSVTHIATVNNNGPSNITVTTTITVYDLENKTVESSQIQNSSSATISGAFTLSAIVHSNSVTGYLYPSRTVHVGTQEYASGSSSTHSLWYGGHNCELIIYW